MSTFLAPLNYDRARDVLRQLNPYTRFTPDGARQVREVLRRRYPCIFERMEAKTLANGALLLEMQGAGAEEPLVFVSHLDAPQSASAAAVQHEVPMSVPVSRAHVAALLEALEALLQEGFQPGGDLLLALSMDGLSGGEGARSIAEHLRARSVKPCLVLDHGGYVTMDAFRTYLPKNAPLALIGITEKGEMHGVLKADDAVCARRGRGHLSPVNELLHAAARLTRRPMHAKLCIASELMLQTLGQRAPFLQRWLVRNPRLTFPLMRILWRRRAIMSQFFWSRRTVCSLSASGTYETPAGSAELRFTQSLIPGQKVSDYRHHLRKLTGNDDLHLSFPVENDASTRSQTTGEAWDALCTAIEIQFDRAVIAPCLSPYVTDARFYAGLGGCIYRFSPFMVSGDEALNGVCTITDDALQTAVQFFRSVLSV